MGKLLHNLPNGTIPVSMENQAAFMLSLLLITNDKACHLCDNVN